MQRKRQRLSAASETIEDGEDDDGILSDSHQEGELDPFTNGYDGSFMDGVMANADGEFDVDDFLGNEAARLAGLQRLVAKRFKRQVANHAAENAIIEEVKCVNFMCHAHLTVTLGPLINFIIGHNGSGKSAVMTALTLCLGGKATATNRGQSLKSFIKEGEDAAMLAVKIKNHGSAAYKRDLYGNVIIVERHFNKNGGSGFKIKNEKEKVVSTKKADLEDIIDAFQLQMDNPMNVLSQDMARQFLNHSTPADKYKFFLEGTQLAALDRDYRILEEFLNETEAKRVIKIQDKDFLQKRKNEAQEKVRALGRQEHMKQKQDLYMRQYAWKQVEVQEEALEGANAQVAEAEAGIQEQTAAIEEISNKFDHAEQDFQQATQNVRECQEAKQPIQDKIEEARAAVNAIKEESMNVIAQQRDIKSELKGDSNIIRQIEESINEERQRQEDANGGEHGRRLQEIHDAKVAAQEKQAAFDELRREYPTLENQRVEAQNHLDQFQPVLDQKRNDVQQQERLIREIRQNQGKWMGGFDRNLPELLRLIDQETRFRNKPVGPMGRHVRLLKPEWSNILEKQAGTQLNAFVVTSKHDQSILRQLMQRSRFPANKHINTPVLIGDPRPLDTAANEPEPHLLTWMRALKFDNDLVRNSLIINNLIDQTVLIEDFQEAYRFALGGSRPQKVKQVFTMTADKRDGTRFGWASSGAGQQSPIMCGARRAPRMQVEGEAHVNVAMSELTQCKRDLQVAENEFRDRQTRLTRANQALQKHKRDVKNLQYDAQRAQEEADGMHDALEAEIPQDGRLEDLERQLQEAQATKETNKNMYEDCQTERDRLDGEHQQRKNRQTEVEKELAEVNARISKAQVRTNRMQEKRDAALHEKNQAFEALEEARAQLESYKRQRDELEEYVGDLRKEASEVGLRPQIPSGETVESLGRKYEKLKAEMDKQAERWVFYAPLLGMLLTMDQARRHTRGAARGKVEGHRSLQESSEGRQRHRDYAPGK